MPIYRLPTRSPIRMGSNGGSVGRAMTPRLDALGFYLVAGMLFALGFYLLTAPLPV